MLEEMGEKKKGRSSDNHYSPFFCLPLRKEGGGVVVLARRG